MSTMGLNHLSRALTSARELDVRTGHEPRCACTAAHALLQLKPVLLYLCYAHRVVMSESSAGARCA
jgi:hypothetical protein